LRDNRIKKGGAAMLGKRNGPTPYKPLSPYKVIITQAGARKKENIK